PTTPPPSSDGCSATLRTDNAWNSGFTATVTVTNDGDAPLSGWSADWAFSGDQRVVNGWNATVTQSGSSVHAVNAGYNGAVPAHGSTSFGFQGTGSAPGAPAITCTAR
ncbi:cellulose binding domain-containing protein, partial [Actinomadura geliboluensis]